MAFFTAGHAQAANDEARVKAGFWKKMKAVAARIPFAEDALAAYYCALDRQTPLSARGALGCARLFYYAVRCDSGLPAADRLHR
jgi:uncharacterized membrane protein YkvA (DUF1232 family)